MKKIVLGRPLTYSDIKETLKKGAQVEISVEAIERIKACKTFLDDTLDQSPDPVYGINTGFGFLHHKRIDNNDLEKLQENLLKSHACGLGDKMPDEVVKLMLVLKIQSLSYGNSGVSLKLVEALIEMFNRNILPVVYSFGSLGASGDLAPLAHLALPLIGLGKVSLNGVEMTPTEAKLTRILLEPKEGLALINGTQFMTACGVWAILQAENLADWADIIGAMSFEAFDGKIDAFNELLQQIRPHPGQIAVAANFRKILQGSELIIQPKKQLQDPYSFRCIPQVHGASRDVLNSVSSVFQIEANAVSDNPNIFPEQHLILSGGNFHGQVLAMHLDFLAIAMSELGSISERRTFQMISGSRDLPLFLIRNPGLNSGFMIPQYTAASIVNRNKILCTPASTDSIPSSNGQEDHVSMGATSAVKCLEVLNNLRSILAIEIFNAAQALEFRRPLKSSIIIENLHTSFRQMVPSINADVEMQQMIENSQEFLRNNSCQWD